MRQCVLLHAVFALTFVVSIPSVAADNQAQTQSEIQAGIGALIDSSPGFFIPILMNGWLIEPSISAKKSKTQTINLVDSSRSRRDTRTATLGVGIYKNKFLVENTYLYSGVRLGFIKRKVKDDREASVILPATSSVSDEDGYFIAPTMGVQYFFIANFSVGIDLTFQFTKTSGDESESSNGVTFVVDAENTSYATSASVIVRYMF